MIKKLIQKPHIFFFGLAVVSLLLSFFFIEESSLDINIHDTYFVIAYSHLLLLSAILFALVGLDYFVLQLVKKPPIKWLTKTHLMLQLLALILLFTPDKWNWLFNFHNDYGYDNLSNANVIITISFLIFFISILIHLINFLVSLLAKKE